jgi:MYXO-CTERM domain-containing protein
MKRALILALLAAALVVPAARADGDPASDFLITQQVFYPYYSNVPKATLKQLEATVADANKKHFTIRVAVITSPYDLGSLSALWEKPQPYCRFLSLELAFAYKNRLLVVSPKGYGYVEKTKPVPAKLTLVRTIPIGKGTDGLLATADKAVRLLAAKAGVKLPAVQATGGGGSGSSMDTIVIAIAAAVGAALVAGIELMRRRRRHRGPAEPKGAHSS